MPLNLHTLKNSRGGRKRSQRIGRGGKRGTYSGRGLKGQRARSGGKKGLKRKGLRQMLERTHKLKGFKSISPKPETISLNVLSGSFKEGEIVSPKTLREKKIIGKNAGRVKILAKGKIEIKLKIEGCQMSQAARTALEQAGGELGIRNKELRIKNKEQ